MSKYAIIYNKAVEGYTYPVAMVNLGVDITDMYIEYNTVVRDKYDPYAFIDWMVNVHAVKTWTPTSKVFLNNFETAYKFNFHKPSLAMKVKLRLKKVKNDNKRNKTTKR